MACTLAKIHNSDLDIRKPYTKIGDLDSYSGRDYDERYVGPFIIKYGLPCNDTTAFLTPAFRNRNIVLTPSVDLVGRPANLYQAFLQLLAIIADHTISADIVLVEAIKSLLAYQNKNRLRIDQLYDSLLQEKNETALAAEAIVKIVEHHLSMSGSSRLPVLVVAAIYQGASQHLGGKLLPLQPHNAADKQTGALGDLQITLADDNSIVTAYEMKNRAITVNDLDLVLIKIAAHPRISNYIFVSTEKIDQSVQDYAAKMYLKTGGIELVTLDCLDFLRYFLHLFHRLRESFINCYQDAVLAEPESAVSHHLKEALLHLRIAAEKANYAW